MVCARIFARLAVRTQNGIDFTIWSCLQDHNIKIHTLTVQYSCSIFEWFKFSVGDTCHVWRTIDIGCAYICGLACDRSSCAEHICRTEGSWGLGASITMCLKTQSVRKMLKSLGSKLLFKAEEQERPHHHFDFLHYEGRTANRIYLPMSTRSELCIYLSLFLCWRLHLSFNFFCWKKLIQSKKVLRP